MANSINMDPIIEIMGRLDNLDAKLETIEGARLGKDVDLVTRARLLKMYHNSQLKKLMALNIYIRMFEGMDENEVVATVPMQGAPNVQGSTTMKKVTAKQQLVEYRRMKVNAQRVLKSTEELLEAEGEVLEPDVVGN